jgi:hypothetical protein
MKTKMKKQQTLGLVVTWLLLLAAKANAQGTLSQCQTTQVRTMSCSYRGRRSTVHFFGKFF